MRGKNYPPQGYTERLNEVMRQQGITQSELARRIGSSHTAVNSWANGDNVTDITTLARIAKTLGVSADFLLFGRG